MLIFKLILIGCGEGKEYPAYSIKAIPGWCKPENRQQGKGVPEQRFAFVKIKAAAGRQQIGWNRG
ncbi:hypothetical protein CVD25_04110 [Bacillus canaveralius]|uniref:Uncharacterized protein n=1 Tax=Bacillus canaveralius TaxID=1403243 RepID=A0A2N5GR63_9BACI|nr:hypothetical protein CU635_02400 [Bacillus canaveralius]PLS00029.1 hypothetical protein CVD25_04110 [Bacillus canaveralius]RSK56235.1 hypothetical protein EJA13_02440 [Bacillus canaveralius]